MNINTQTRVCALIGDPVSHSLSPAIHNAAFEGLGLNYIYLAFRVKDCAGAIAGARAFDQIKGLSVTIPHKISVCNYLDWIDDVASRIGSVNTVVKEGDRLKGYNTDGFGAITALKEAGVKVDGRKVIMIGSGGVARGISFSLLMDKNPPSAICILGIEEEQVSGLISDLACLKIAEVNGGSITQDRLKSEIKVSQILIHCTPVGMWPKIQNSVISADLLHPGIAVFDAVYNPLKTRLLEDAESKGCKIIDGLAMFLNQALGQFKLWTGQDAPLDIMRNTALRYLLKDRD